MYPSELSKGLGRRSRSTSVHKRTRIDSTNLPGTSGRSFLASVSSSCRKMTNFEATFEDSQDFPPLIKYLEQVTLELIVTKKHTDVRYVLVVHQTELNVMWRLSRSFDEYRKLQQRLLKLLRHGHFCNADCPWLYGFLKSYFPKKLLFTFSSTRVIEQRKEKLEQFFAALYGFFMEKKNFSCDIVMTKVAGELIEFIYGDALERYGLQDAIESTQNDALHPPLTLQLRERDVDKLAAPFSRKSSLTNSFRSSLTDENGFPDVNCGNCGICQSSLCGAAFGSLTSTSSSIHTASPSSTEANGSMMLLRTSSSDSNNNNNNCDIIHPPYLATNGSSRSLATNGGGSRRKRSSASRRRAATYYLTTLTCGHQFHDECIVPKLNESLECPTCGRVQTNY